MTRPAQLIAKRVAVVLIVATAAGMIAGFGLCEYAARSRPRQPDVSQGYVSRLKTAEAVVYVRRSEKMAVNGAFLFAVVCFLLGLATLADIESSEKAALGDERAG